MSAYGEAAARLRQELGSAFRDCPHWSAQNPKGEYSACCYSLRRLQQVVYEADQEAAKALAILRA